MTTTRSHRTVRRIEGARPGIRLTRRGRIALVILLAAALLAAFWLGNWRAGVAATADSESGVAHRVVVLRPGQTLWEVAAQQDPEADPRKVVHRIVKLNDLPSVSVRAGQRILLPAPT